MLGEKGQWKIAQRVLAVVLAITLGLSLGSCSAPSGSGVRSSKGLPKIGMVKLAEVAPPPVIRKLKQELEVYQPQVQILSPKPNEVLQDSNVKVRLQVQDLPLFKDEELGLSPHLHVIVDNQPYIAVYDVSQPLELEDLEPGSHTIRAFASRPWHESFKNDGAYAQTNFHIFTKTPENVPDLKQPLLTYSRPKGSYGAEPIMLDFYLANVPLHLVAQEDAEDNILDWQVRCTIDGESFTVDRWEPIYLKGLKPGKNWVQLELLDESGKVVPNAFNDTVRLIDYQPGGTDTLSKLVRDEISIAEVRGIIDPNYVYVPAPEPTVEPAEEPVEETAREPATPTPNVAPAPVLDTEPTLEPVLPGTLPVPVPEILPSEELIPAVEAPPEVEPAEEEQEEPEENVAPSPSVATPSALKAPTAEKVKEQFSEEVKELLEEGELEPPTSQTIEPILPPEETVEILPPTASASPSDPVAPSVTPIAPPVAPSSQSPKRPLRQWRERLKQFIPLPEPSSAKSDSSVLKGVSNRTRGLQEPQPLKTPEIIDIPATEDFQTPIATPNLQQTPAITGSN